MNAACTVADIIVSEAESRGFYILDTIAIHMTKNIYLGLLSLANYNQTTGNKLAQQEASTRQILHL